MDGMVRARIMDGMVRARIMDGMVRARVDCVGAIVRDESGRLLLVRRGQPPGQGLWSVPGGRVEPGESDEVATVREAWEETGLDVRVDVLAGVVERDAPDGSVFVIRDYRCRLLDPEGAPRAGTDAAEVGWFTARQVRRLGCVPGLVAALEEWQLL